MKVSENWDYPCRADHKKDARISGPRLKSTEFMEFSIVGTTLRLKRISLGYAWSKGIEMGKLDLLSIMFSHNF